MPVEINPLALALALEDAPSEDRETRPTIEGIRIMAEDDRARAEVRVNASTEAKEARPQGARVGRLGAARRRIVREMNVRLTAPSADPAAAYAPDVPTAPAAGNSSSALPSEAPRAPAAGSGRAFPQAFAAAIVVVNLLHAAAPFHRTGRMRRLWRAMQGALGAWLVSKALSGGGRFPRPVRLRGR